MLDFWDPKVKFLLRAALGLTQAEGRKEPMSAAMPAAANTGFVGVVGAEVKVVEEATLLVAFLSTDSSITFSLSFFESSSFTSTVSLLGSSFLVLLLGGPTSSSLSARTLLLVILVRPGGGDDDGLPSKGESWRGGRFPSEM